MGSRLLALAACLSGCTSVTEVEVGADRGLLPVRIEAMFTNLPSGETAARDMDFTNGDMEVAARTVGGRTRVSMAMEFSFFDAGDAAHLDRSMGDKLDALDA